MTDIAAPLLANGPVGPVPGSMISIRGLTKSYRSRGAFLRARSRVDVLRGLNLEVDSGQILGIVGANGAGKTTLLEILATLVLPDAGRVSVAGHDLVGDAGEVRRLVAYSPASAETFYPRLTGYENLEFFAALHGVVGIPAREMIRDALGAVAIEHAAHVTVQTYSDGMRQRLAIARALVSGRRVLLLDEPTKSLDPAARAATHRLLRRTLVDGLRLTLLLVTHSVEEAAAVCDRVVVLEGGRVTSAGLSDAVIMKSSS